MNEAHIHSELKKVLADDSIVAASYDILYYARLLQKDEMIRKLRKDLDEARKDINELHVERGLILKEQNKEIESLKNEIEILKNKSVKNIKHVVISTENNIVYYPTSVHNHNNATSKIQSAESKVDSSKRIEANVLKKKTTKKTKEVDVSSIAYNLRSRSIVKLNEKSKVGCNY